MTRDEVSAGSSAGPMTRLEADRVLSRVLVALAAGAPVSPCAGILFRDIGPSASSDGETQSTRQRAEQENR